MFDSESAFAKAFTPVDGGYLYYRSAKSGGRLVTTEEYNHFIQLWQRVAGTRGLSMLLGAIFLWIAFESVISINSSLPHWAGVFLASIGPVVMGGWIGWFAFAPWRLVRHRPVVAPPRLLDKVRQEARASVGFGFVVLMLIFSAAIFAKHFWAPDRSPASWLWIVGSGAMFGVYIWIAVLKLADRFRVSQKV